jgi:hypothetical protein
MDMVSAKQGEVDIEKLKSLYSSNDAARAFLDYAAQRERSAAETSVDRIQANLAAEGHAFPRQEVMELLKALAKAGCGDFKVGRRGLKSRLVWKAGLASVGRAASGQTQSIEVIAKGQQERDSLGETVTRLTHSYHLRPNVVVEFNLPTDLTESEANRLADYLKTLPFRR